jgi:hypothetical protein
MQLIIDIPSSKVSFAQNVLNLSKQTEELYGIFEGINAPDKKDIRKAMYESNNK